MPAAATAKGATAAASAAASDAKTIEMQLDLLKVYEDRTRYWARRALREHPTAGGDGGAENVDREARSE